MNFGLAGQKIAILLAEYFFVKLGCFGPEEIIFLFLHLADQDNMSATCATIEKSKAISSTHSKIIASVATKTELPGLTFSSKSRVERFALLSA